MKLIEKFKLTFITPCFCAGANQKIAEIRPSSIRGELRWWFRCLGGTQAQESQVFGSTAGSETSSSSPLVIRVANIQLSDTYHEPTFTSPNDPGSYHHYFLSAPNENLNKETRMWETPPDKQKGKIRKESQIPKESTFELQLYLRRNLPEETKKLLEKTISIFKQLGSIGYRKTRGFGAWRHDDSIVTSTELSSILDSLDGFSHQMGNIAASPDMPFNQIEGKIKGNKKAQTGLRLKWPAKYPSPLGTSEGIRQTSSVYFRPTAVKTKKGDIQYTLVIFQAPDSVLGEETIKHIKNKKANTRIIPMQK